MPGEREAEARPLLFCLADLDERGDHSAMFVVMTAGASEAEVLGVKSRILAEGLTPYDHQARRARVIAVVGEIG